MGTVGLLVHAVAFEQLAFPLNVKFIAFEVGINKRLSAFRSLRIFVLTGNLQVSQLLDVYVEVDWTLFFFA